MKNKLINSLLVLAVGGLLLTGSAVAQTSTTPAEPGAGPGAVDPDHPRVNQVNSRLTNQQNRIGNGVKNDKLTPGQTAHLENNEQKIANEEKKDMAKHGGHLTKQEQARINHQLNQQSKQIYKDKHDK